MVPLDTVLSFLSNNGIRASFGAVGEVAGIYHRNLRYEYEFVDRDPRTAWVVYQRTGQPPPELHEPRPDESELIVDGWKLAKRMRASSA